MDWDWGMIGVVAGNVVALVSVFVSLKSDLAIVMTNQGHLKENMLEHKTETARLRDVCDRRVHRGP